MQIAAINNFGSEPYGVQRFKIPNGNGLFFEHHMFFFFSLTGYLLQYSPFKGSISSKRVDEPLYTPKEANLIPKLR